MKTELQLEQEIRKIRQGLFDLPESEQDAATERIGELKTELARARTAVPAKRGVYSGLTRAELSRSGTCETDWY